MLHSFAAEHAPWDDGGEPHAHDRKPVAVPYYVIGGDYSDTTFTRLVRPAPVRGPFAGYDEAYAAWRAVAVATIDQAYTRFWIVEADEPPDAEAPPPHRDRRA